MTRTLRFVLAATLLSAGCATHQATGSPLSTAPGELPGNIQWVQRSAEYSALALQAYRVATAHVETAAKGRTAGTWAVVLDADDTIINNTEYQARLVRRGVRHSEDLFTEWARERASTAVPGARTFLTRVRELGGRIAIVTNRIMVQCPDTEAVFKTLGMMYDVMLCRPDGASSDKNPRFDAVAAGQTAAGRQPLDVVAFVGDNIHDFPGGSQALRAQPDTAFSAFGVRYFILPNPMYGSWEQPR
jgi:5'-nucleotidase (lipoprotein e(P4) family)